MHNHKKRILLTVPGHLKTVPMNRFVYETLKSMGHEVELFDTSAQTAIQKFHKSISKNGFYNKRNSQLLLKIKTFRPDLLFSIFGFDIHTEILDAIKGTETVSACWWLNDPFQYTKSIRKAPYYDYYFTNANATVAQYKKDGITNIHYLPVGIYPTVHRKIPKIDKSYDILFAGDYSPLREKIISDLLPEFKVAVFGPWKKLPASSPVQKAIIDRNFFTPEKMNLLFNKAKIVLNIHTWMQKSTHGINPRLFEACGSGSFQITDDKDDISMLFNPGKELETYRDIETLKKKLDYYLTHENKREDIAQAGYRRVCEEHTYTQRMQRMLQIVFEKEMR